VRVQDTFRVPKGCDSVTVIFEGDGNPDHLHDIVAVCFRDQWGKDILRIGGLNDILRENVEVK